MNMNEAYLPLIDLVQKYCSLLCESLIRFKDEGEADVPMHSGSFPVAHISGFPMTLIIAEKYDLKFTLRSFCDMKSKFSQVAYLKVLATNFGTGALKLL